MPRLTWRHHGGCARLPRLGSPSARRIVEVWRQGHNPERPRNTLDFRTPEEFRQAEEASAITQQEWAKLSKSVDRTPGQVTLPSQVYLIK